MAEIVLSIVVLLLNLPFDPPNFNSVTNTSGGNLKDQSWENSEITEWYRAKEGKVMKKCMYKNVNLMS